MPIALHLSLLFIANIIALIGGFILGMSTHQTIQYLLPEMLQEKVLVFIVFGMIPAALGLKIVGQIFRHFITGRCPKCRGRAIYHASRTEKALLVGTHQVPITYHCQKCGHVHRTRIYPASPMHPH